MTILGISNVSFGLPKEGREVLNAVYFYHCVQAGLDMAIVNPENLIRYNNISTKEIELSENLIFNQSMETITQFTEYFRNKDPSLKSIQKDSNKQSPDVSLKSAIVMGTKSNVISDLDNLLKKLSPLEIINSIIMSGMDEVGRLFEQGKMIVTEVLQSAEVVKKAVSYLEPLMLNQDDSNKKKILLATVKGDVHDIGKNLVRIIFESNGYKVVDIGIRIDSNQLIKSIKEHNPDIVGLSGLLVKSSRYMVNIAEHLKEEGIDLPLIVGGAALTLKFVNKEIVPKAASTVIYARDAMSGLSKVNSLFRDN